MDKKCKTCEALKPNTEFNKDLSRSDGLANHCRACAALRQAAYTRRPEKTSAPEGMKRCWTCKQTLPHDNFTKSGITFDGFMKACRKCNLKRSRYWRENNREHFASYMREYRKTHLAEVKDNERKKKFAVPSGWYAETLTAQGGACAICLTTEAKGRGDFHIDHCHVSGKIRGLLCQHCNLMLGHARDRADVLLEAVAYLKRHC